jgi:hypothetical protein
VAHKFEKFDGGLLMELKNMYDRSPNVFYQNCKDDLGLHRIRDLLRFTQQLDMLTDFEAAVTAATATNGY